MDSGRIGSAPKNAVEETMLQGLGRIMDERIGVLRKLNHRMDSFLDRAAPQPEAVSGSKEQTEPPIDNTVSGLQRRLAILGENLDRLAHLCERLERIA